MLAAVVLVLLWRFARQIIGTRHRLWDRLAAVWLIGSLLLSGILGAGGDRWALLTAEVTGWSRMLLTAARFLSDWDRDGYSGHFAGGDCEPLKAEIHPGAPEIIGDGLDNNCFGGDATQPVQTDNQTWLVDFPPVRNAVVITIEALRADLTSLGTGHSYITVRRSDFDSTTSALRSGSLRFRLSDSFIIGLSQSWNPRSWI